jgi:uncharacterized protein DUF2513
MTVELDLVRSLLLRVERLTHRAPLSSAFDGYDERSLCECVRLLAGEGYLDADLCWTLNEEKPEPLRLTWMGVVLVNAIRNDAVWSRAKQKFAESATPGDLNQLRSVLEETALEMANDPLIDIAPLCARRAADGSRRLLRQENDYDAK